MRNLILIGSAVLFLGACATRTKILDAAAISMTQPNLAAGTSLTETGTVTGKYCSDMMNDKGSIGVIDEAVKNAQTQHQVDWILNAGIWTDGSCTEVEGTGARIASAGHPAAPNVQMKKASPVKQVPAKKVRK